MFLEKLFMPNEEPAKPKRIPLGVVVLLCVLGGINFVRVGVVKVVGLEFIGGFLALVLGLLFLAGGFGVWRVTAWGWYLTVGGSIISTGNCVYTIVKGTPLLAEVPGITISLVIFVYLVLKRGYFFPRPGR